MVLTRFFSGLSRFDKAISAESFSLTGSRQQPLVIQRLQPEEEFPKFVLLLPLIFRENPDEERREVLLPELE
jgi:hypothetical protein